MVQRFNLRADARVRVHKPLRNCHGSRRKGKNRDKFIDTTDRVGFSDFLIEFLIQILSWLESRDSENNQVHYILVQVF